MFDDVCVYILYIYNIINVYVSIHRLIELFDAICTCWRFKGEKHMCTCDHYALPWCL